METTEDILGEMRKTRPDCDECLGNHTCEYLHRFADRIDAAYRKDLQELVEAGERDMETAMACVERTLSEYRAENARLRESLKQVLDCPVEKFKRGVETHAVAPICTSSEHGVEDAEGDAIQDESIATALNAMLEAQRICNGGVE